MDDIIPKLRIDPRLLPPPLLTSELNSFAHNTLRVRVPQILRDVIADNDAELRNALEDLYKEITEGKIGNLKELTEDKALWDEAAREYVGRSWLDVPWYWAEAYFFRRVLEATRYFQRGRWYQVDPYYLKKQSELAPDAAPRAVADFLTQLPDDRRARFLALLHAALWGNRYDLSMDVAALVVHASNDERANLLVDDSARVWESMGRSKRIAYIADNAGTELAMDIALIDFLLSENFAAQIVLHLKPQPFFVSDAMPRDFDAMLTAFAQTGGPTRALADRVRGFGREKRLCVTTHWFYPSSLFYFQLPADLRADLAAMDLVIIKGDANYRRLLGDAHWDPTTPFELATSYFPAPFVSLRTLKAEVIVGLTRNVVERLNREESAWLVNGKRGVIQSNLKI